MSLTDQRYRSLWKFAIPWYGASVRTRVGTYNGIRWTQKVMNWITPFDHKRWKLPRSISRATVIDDRSPSCMNLTLAGAGVKGLLLLCVWWISRWTMNAHAWLLAWQPHVYSSPTSLKTIFLAHVSITDLSLFRAGSERFDSGRGGGPFRPPVRSRKPSIGATIGKRFWIGLSKIYNFYIKHFRVRSILRSPEVIKYKMSKKNCLNL